MLKIEYWDIEKVQPYANNAKRHPEEQIEQIKQSMIQMGNGNPEKGFLDPIGIWNGEIVEGHGRYFAAKELNLKKIPVIVLDDLTDEQRKAYALIHNKLTMNTGFDFDILTKELQEIQMDMEQFGFEKMDLNFDETDLDDTTEKENVYVTLNCGDMSNYEVIKERLQKLADEIGANVSLKMA